MKESDICRDNQIPIEREGKSVLSLVGRIRYRQTKRERERAICRENNQIRTERDRQKERGERKGGEREGKRLLSVERIIIYRERKNVLYEERITKYGQR